MSNLEQNSYFRIIQNLVKLEAKLSEPDELVFEFVKDKTVNLGNSVAYHFKFFKAFDIELNKDVIRVEYQYSSKQNNESRRFDKPEIRYYFGSIDNFGKVETNKVFESLKDLYESI